MGGGAHSAHLSRGCCAAFTVAGGGVTRSLVSVLLVTVPSLHTASMAAAVSVRRWMRPSAPARLKGVGVSDPDRGF